MKISALCFFIYTFYFVKADFIYDDFNETTGLIFNGDAGTTVCYDETLLKYGDVAGKADTFDEGGSAVEIGESSDQTFSSSVTTNVAKDNADIAAYTAGFLHRGNTLSAPDICHGRIRLTPSGANKAGSVWYRDDVLVNKGFDTLFTFQITDHSKECVLRKDQYFSQRSYETCSVRGADGFAFVIQADARKTRALGDNGGQMGFGGPAKGIQNSLAIAFDTWQNPGQDRFGVDHVSFQSRGSKSTNDALEAGLLGLPRITMIADGKVHRARIVYFSSLQSQYLSQLVASDSLLPYLLDNGEQKRVGTLVVFVDEGIDNDVPLMAMPINLSLLLDLPTDKAFVGFTSSTGRFFAKHDIVSWHFCNEVPCQTVNKRSFDYHQAPNEMSDEGLRWFAQGPGFGGDGNPKGFPSRHTSPDTTPEEVPLQYFATGRAHNLYENAGLEVPPDTLY